MLRRGELAAVRRDREAFAVGAVHTAFPLGQRRATHLDEVDVLCVEFVFDLGVNVDTCLYDEPFVSEVLVKLRVAAGREDDADDYGADEGEKRTSERESFGLRVV